MDEKIIELMREVQKEINQASGESNDDKVDVQKPFIKIKGEVIPFEEKRLLGNSLKIHLPKAFSIMSPKMAALKYPSEKRPTLIYTNEDTTINMAFNYTKSQLKNSDVDSFKNNMVQILKKTQPLARWFDEGVENINGQNVGYCDFLVPSLDATIYNLLFFTDLRGKALLCTFNCLEEEMTDWKPIAKGIMESLYICAEEEGETSV
ncbi:hypothetical protein [Aneurinibacillus soli]